MFVLVTVFKCCVLRQLIVSPFCRKGVQYFKWQYLGLNCSLTLAHNANWEWKITKPQHWFASSTGIILGECNSIWFTYTLTVILKKTFNNDYILQQWLYFPCNTSHMFKEVEVKWKSSTGIMAEVFGAHSGSKSFLDQNFYFFQHYVIQSENFIL